MSALIEKIRQISYDMKFITQKRVYYGRSENTKVIIFSLDNVLLTQILYHHHPTNFVPS